MAYDAPFARCSRRQLLTMVASAVATGPLHAQLQAGSANRPVRVVVPFAPGGATDVIARVLGERMAQDFSQPVLVENKTGAAGLLAGEAVVRSVPDGTTLLLGSTSSMLSNKYLYKKAAYDPLVDLKPLTRVCAASIVMVVHSAAPVRNMQEFMAWIKERKSKFSYGSYGIGSQAQLVGAMLSDMAGADMVHVAYRGEAPMVQGMLTGEIQVSTGSVLSIKPHIDSGKLRPLAVTGLLRMPLLPDMPTFEQAGYQGDALNIGGWLGIAGPKDLPDATAKRWAEIINRAVASRQVTARIIAAGFIPLNTDTPEGTARLWAQEGPVWQRMFQRAGIEPT
ncbi:Tripartite-type tricarboxylate transporter, receptor component TctC [Oryzisolibacter propanilivorax]|uniref:Tripartite-type tricarboxylate transporter, receptor component TctC n=1 Tax=Oryzisolibacter propanilivorax TaxID=1527607 RepID=A0A1G9QC53_9BURK|nr:tripartite tricarboxylate transporter substrate binding protein [Oryzisolibacter propanilivorax]SDM08311.1 Tripartite-type tricarboxylate transporter, receptor component TctC [Oryzisolibacter propanilivorax]